MNTRKTIERHKEFLCESYPGQKRILLNGFYGIHGGDGRIKEYIYIGPEFVELEGIVYKGDKPTKIKI